MPRSLAPRFASPDRSFYTKLAGRRVSAATGYSNGGGEACLREDELQQDPADDPAARSLQLHPGLWPGAARQAQALFPPHPPHSAPPQPLVHHSPVLLVHLVVHLEPLLNHSSLYLTILMLFHFHLLTILLLIISFLALYISLVLFDLFRSITSQCSCKILFTQHCTTVAGVLHCSAHLLAAVPPTVIVFLSRAGRGTARRNAGKAGGAGWRGGGVWWPGLAPAARTS